MSRILTKTPGKKIEQVQEIAGGTIMSGALEPRRSADQLGDKARPVRAAESLVNAGLRIVHQQLVVARVTPDALMVPSA